MTKRNLILILLMAASFSSRAQYLTKFGDDVSSLDGIIKAFYSVTCVKIGQQSSYERDSLLHRPGALVGLSGADRAGNPYINTMTLKRFHELEDPEMAKTGFNERSISRKVEKFGNIYHVFSTYETRYAPDDPIIGRGIDSIELYYDGKRFWILSWFGDVERKGNPLTKEYMPGNQN